MDNMINMRKNINTTMVTKSLTYLRVDYTLGCSHFPLQNNEFRFSKWYVRF